MLTLQTLRRSAEAIERHVLQLERQGGAGRQLVVPMAPHLPDLQLILDNASDAQLAELCRDYPGFYRYACVMEEVVEAERRPPSADPDAVIPLAEPLRSRMVELIRAVATLENDWQSLIEQEHGPVSSDLARQLQQLQCYWLEEQAAFQAQLRSSGLPDRSCAFVTTALEQFRERLEMLQRTVSR